MVEHARVEGLQPRAARVLLRPRRARVVRERVGIHGGDRARRRGALLAGISLRGAAYDGAGRGRRFAARYGAVRRRTNIGPVFEKLEPNGVYAVVVRAEP